MSDEKKENKFQIVKNMLKNNMSKKKIIITSIVLAIVLLLILIFCTIFSLSNMGNTKIIQGVKINNIDVAGLTKEEATSKIQEIVNLKNESTIKLVKDDFNNEISIEQLEVNYNVEETVEQAFLVGRSGNIFTNNFEILASKNKGKNIELNIEFNNEKLNKVIDEINGEIPGAMKDNSYYI